MSIGSHVFVYQHYNKSADTESRCSKSNQPMKKSLLLAAASLLIYFGASAAIGDTFKVDKMTFTVTSETEHTVEFTKSTATNASLVIPSTVSNGSVEYTVTSIGTISITASAVKSVTIAATISKIAEDGFGMANLDAIYVEEGNKTFSSYDGALYNCNQDTLVLFPWKKKEANDFPATLTTLAKQSFKKSIIESLSLPNSVTAIGDSTFFDCSKLTAIILSNSLATIGNYSFANCETLTAIDIPNTVTTIGKNAFNSCYQLRTVTLPNSLSTIKERTFYSCNSLSSINIPQSVTTIGKSAFSDCSALTSVDIPNSVTTIEESAFSRCSVLTSFDIPISVTTIGENAFYGCNSLTSISIPNSVTTIESGAFAGCGFTTVNLPASISSFGNGVFSGCDNLENISVDQDSKILSSINGILFSADGNTLLAVPNKKAIGEFIIPDNVTVIADYAFQNCKDLKSLTIPNSVKNIGVWTFGNCPGLTSLTLPNSVISIGDYCFSNCTNLVSVTLSSSLTMINQCAFAYCSSLKSIDLPNSITSIGNNSFQRCGALTSIALPQSLTAIGNFAFSMCTSLTSIIIPSGVENIGVGAFINCTNLTKLWLLPTTPPILYSNNAFGGVPQDSKVYIPAGTLDDYSEATGWNYFSDFIEFGRVNIILSETELNLKIEEKATVSAEIEKDDDISIESKSWESTNSEIASVDDGVVTAHLPGVATISFTAIDGLGIPHTSNFIVRISANTGIESVAEYDFNSPVEYYKLNGIRIEAGELQPGLYIKRQGGKVSKVMIK